MAGYICEKILELCENGKHDKHIYQALREGKCKYCSNFHGVPIWYRPQNWNSVFTREDGMNMVIVTHPRKKNSIEFFEVPS